SGDQEYTEFVLKLPSAYSISPECTAPFMGEGINLPESFGNKKEASKEVFCTGRGCRNKYLNTGRLPVFRWSSAHFQVLYTINRSLAKWVAEVITSFTVFPGYNFKIFAAFSLYKDSTLFLKLSGEGNFPCIKAM